MTKSITVACLSLTVSAAFADPKLPAIFGDNMVLQGGGKVPIWGTAEPYERIDVEFNGQHRTVYAGKDGYWLVELRNLEVGGPYVLTVKGKATREFKNVLVGDVWLASGQSNMEWAWNYFPANKKPPIGEADFPNIRFFQVTKKASGEPEPDVQGQWVMCTPETMKNFSLVSFFFARTIHQKVKTPIAVIGSYWGGTPAEAWTRMSALDSMPETKPMADHYRNTAANYGQAQADYEKKLAEWNLKARITDTGNQGLAKGWAGSSFDDITWPSLKQPVGWEQSGKKDLDIDGIVWFRKQVSIPSDWAGRDLTLQLGPIDDTDTTYFNGAEVGVTGPDVADSWQKPRVYRIPGRLVKSGMATIAVRVVDTGGGGGMTSGPMTLTVDDLSTGPINLATEWKYQIESGRATLPQSFLNTQPQQPYGPGSAVAPTNLWNGMIAPLIPFAIKGAIWYQGESNAGRAYQYRSLFPGMIKDWRMAWGRGDFPFYFVQLANFMAKTPEPVESEWAELREAQTMTLRLKNTGMAVAIDVGEAGDIHPVNKEAVGERLARLALAQDYGQKAVVPSGPLYKTHLNPGNGRIVITFDHASMGLATISGQELKGFAIAGNDRKFVWAQAKIEGSSVVVWSPLVKNPEAVRYSWSNNPDGNLINKAGLPASPFRTDTWPGLTVDRR
jgi:sialate O-acetylesterase